MQVKPGESVLLPEWVVWDIRVEKAGLVSRYTPKAPDTAYVLNRGFGPWVKRIFKAQIDAGGQIFVLKPAQSAPTTEFVEQPAGFPLVPIVGQ
jgi:hypothetical protein